MSSRKRELVFLPGRDGRVIVGRVIGKYDKGWLVIDGIDGKAHNVALLARSELGVPGPAPW